MLASKNRLTSATDFAFVKEKGKILRSQSFTLSYVKKDDTSPTRLGFIVSTKVAKEATRRNKVKRALREGVRQRVNLMKKGYDIVFIAHESSVKTYTNDLMKEAEEALVKAGLMQ